jgi:hypothetical protein
MISTGLAGAGLALIVFVFVKLVQDMRWRQAFGSKQDGRRSLPVVLWQAGWVLSFLGLLGIAIQRLIRGRFP